MNRTGMRRRLAARTGLSARRSARALEAVLDAVAGALARGETVPIRGLGTLGPREGRGAKRTVRLAPSRSRVARRPDTNSTKILLGGDMDQKANQDERGGTEHAEPRGNEHPPLGLDVGTSRIVLSRARARARRPIRS